MHAFIVLVFLSQHLAGYEISIAFAYIVLDQTLQQSLEASVSHKLKVCEWKLISVARRA